MGEKQTKRGSFERSPELKRVFNELSEKWCRTHRLSLSDLADRCGVSLQYLSHIGRYGRVPSRPILMLLALNLELPDPGVMFRLAGIPSPWPFERGVGLRRASAAESGFLSVQLDMHGFADAIRQIVRAEMQPKRLEELLGSRALRVGLNRGQFFLFTGTGHEGFFPEMMRALAISLHCRIDFVEIAHSDYLHALSEGIIDVYGPVYRTAPRLGRALYSPPFCTVPAAAIGRTKRASALAPLPAPRMLSELRTKEYVVAVHEESMAHHLALTELSIPADRIIPCSLPDEALERVMLTKLARPAHLMLTDRPFARRARAAHGSAVSLLFAEDQRDLPRFEDTIAVRPDWPVLLDMICQSLDLLRRGGALERLFERTVAEGSDAVMLASGPTV